MNVNVKKEFLDKLSKNLSKIDFDKYLISLKEKDIHGFSINLKKLSKSNIDLDYVIDRFKAKIIYKNDNFAYLTYDKDELIKNSVFPGKDILYHVGLYYIQEPSAASTLYDVDIKSTDAILDVCASPGGKSIEALYNLDKNSGGFLLANEIKNDRAKILLSNIERMGFDNAIVTNNSVSELSKKFIEYFDKVIVDAPCSGEGMFRKSEEARFQWSENLVKSCAKIQKEIIDESYKMLKTGGILIYSTCTFSKEEDEDNVDYILNKYSDMKLVKMEKKYPFNSVGEGQFFAILKKGICDIGYKNKWPELNELNGLHVIMYGLKLYDEKDSIKKPSHAVTHNDNSDVLKNIVELDDIEVYKYLHGDVIRKNVSFTGWCKVTYKGMGVGLAKAVNGVLKNHYPKGLRIYQIR